MEHAGITVLYSTKNDVVTLKIRRPDSGRNDMGGEADMMSAANETGAGPRLVSHSNNFLVMKYLKGEGTGGWIRGRSAGDKETAILHIRKILEDCYKPGMAGIDHGELSSMNKHVITEDMCSIIDFDSSGSVMGTWYKFQEPGT
ncbi:Ser/Thr protein kinase [Cenarchaeum symbiosum A]|uniref:Ser/Thr protein kinase n=1 Tax=Cenarchaeum symbiosum (strain A) TaxID=414004 RepID=A0RVB4_CENSY|nr:Ser/Thr protein kinase [Cenarchaeum symbiosum A]